VWNNLAHKQTEANKAFLSKFFIKVFYKTFLFLPSNAQVIVLKTILKFTLN
jgi:hypothetical protein